MNKEIISKIKDINRITVPKDVIELIIDKLGEDIIWDYDIMKEEIIIMKRPDSYVEALTGLGEDMWKNAGGTDYIKKERKQWS